jgi:hypothetical protein
VQQQRQLRGFQEHSWEEDDRWHAWLAQRQLTVPELEPESRQRLILDKWRAFYFQKHVSPMFDRSLVSACTQLLVMQSNLEGWQY